MIRTRSALAALMAVGLSLAACGGGDDAATSTTTSPPDVATSPPPTSPPPTAPPTAPPTPPPTLAPPSTPAPVSTTIAPDILRMPLTGQPIDDPAAIPNRPALAAKFPNDEAARPQSGINEADIVFEEIINDGYTRLAGVFHSQGADVIGPIRSGRHPDILLLEAFNHPLFVWSGGNGGVTYYIERSQLVDLSFLHTSGYYRRSGRKSPNNLYTSTEAMWEKAPEGATPPPGVLQYLRPGEQLSGEAATSIDVVLDNQRVHWEYDFDSGRYYRWQNDREHNTENSGQVSTENVVVMLADYLPSPIDARTPDAQVLGSNPVYIFSGGTVRVGVWLRFASTDRYAFFDNLTDLNEIHLQPGRTFIELPRNVFGAVTWE